MAYFASGTEGDRLEYQCSRCILDIAVCPVYKAQIEFNYEAIDSPVARKILNELVADNDKICELRELLVKQKILNDDSARRKK